MTICVFGASSTKIDNKYVERVEEMGCKLAQNGHNLVFGAGGTGLMGAAARGFKKGGAHIHGVIPKFFSEQEHVIEPVYSDCDEVTRTETMRERKAIMEDNADAFIIVPGGVGTFEEFFEILTLKELKRHNKPIVIFNIDGYYDSMIKLMEECVDKKFIIDSLKEAYNVYDDIEDIANFFA